MKSLAEPIVIKDLDHLKEMAGSLAPGGGVSGGEFAICLIPGVAKSSKTIKYYNAKEVGDGPGEEWDVFHSISDCWCEYESTEEFVEQEPAIMEAIEKGTLAFLYAS